MNVLAINCGSSSLKFGLIDIDEHGSEELARGLVDDIGGESSVDLEAGGTALNEAATVSDHRVAVHRVLRWLASVGYSAGQGIDAVGHRVVHGGDRFREAAVIDDGVVEEIEAVSELAPLHNAPALSAIRTALEDLGSVPADRGNISYHAP